MLYSLDKMEHITKVPHRREYDLWLSRLSADEIQAIKAKLNSLIAKGEVHTSSWMPGNDWTGTVYQPIWEKACKKSVSEAVKCFGLMLWSNAMGSDDRT